MQKNKSNQTEFIAMMASLMSIVALSIDALLLALEDIGRTVGTTNPSENQLLIIMIFLGLGVCQLFFGPISDSVGRKPVVYMGFGLFIIANILCINSESLEVMIFGRIPSGNRIFSTKNHQCCPGTRFL